MRTIYRVIQAVLSLQKEWINWPSVEQRRGLQEFMQEKLPKCVGFIDGSHINLDEAPLDDPESYFSRKQLYALYLQAICDMDRRIRHIVVGFPGSVHDARVYMNSEVGAKPDQFLSDGEWIAGDSAYGLTTYLLTPFRSNATMSTPRKRRMFNKYFSSYRVKIECCFGAMKEIFGILKGLRIRVDRGSGHKLATEWITACCILYNIILPSIEMDSSIYDCDEDEDDENDGASQEGTGEERRKLLFDFVMHKLGL